MKKLTIQDLERRFDDGKKLTSDQLVKLIRYELDKRKDDKNSKNPL